MIKRKLVFGVYQRLRIWKYRFISTCKRIEGKPLLAQPAELSGEGRIVFNGRVRLGCYPSPFCFNEYIYIEARKQHSRIEINDGVWVNNGTVMISEGEGIFIGEKTLIGTHVEIYDSDFHGLAPDKRMVPGTAATAPVRIGKNVFIGSNAKVLKGVTIGDNSVLGCGSVVVSSIPANVVAAGVPAKVIKSL